MPTLMAGPVVADGTLRSAGQLLPGLQALAFALAWVCGVVNAQTINVDTLVDDPAANTCGDLVPSDCSIRGAIAFAERVPGDQTINIPQGFYLIDDTLTVSESNLGTTHLSGAGMLQTQIVGGQGFTSFFLRGGPVVLSDLGVIGADTSVPNSTTLVVFNANQAEERVTLERVRIAENVGDIGHYAVWGNDNLEIRDSIIEDNDIFVAVFLSGGGLISGSAIRDNSDVGVFFGGNGSFLIQSSTISGNDRGIRAPTGTLVIEGSTVRGHSANADGSAIDVLRLIMRDSAVIENSTFSGRGAGLILGDFLDVDESSSSIVNSTFSGNRTGLAGRGTAISVRPRADLTLNHVTINANTSFGGGDIENEGSITVSNSILVGNLNSTCVGNPLVSLGGNVSRSAADVCQLTAASDLAEVPEAMLQLAALGDNGGLTPTHNLGVDSVARLNATSVDCRPFDQRGFPRLADQCDSGALQATNSELVFSNGFESG